MNPIDRLSRNLVTFFRRNGIEISPRTPFVVGFSGGPDSTALLVGLSELPLELRAPIFAAHLDHGLDQGSAGRCEAAAGLAARIGVPFIGRRLEVRLRRLGGETLEAAARRLRYAFLERCRCRLGAAYVLTAHHRGDQAETLMLRLLFGSGLKGLGGIRPLLGCVLRPLLEVDRGELLAVVEARRLEAVLDPTNDDLSNPRNRLRHLVLPRLLAQDPELTSTLQRLASAARGSARHVEALLGRHLGPEERSDGVVVPRRVFEALPEELHAPALALVNRIAGLHYPMARTARAELRRQLREGGKVGCDAGGGWRWETDGHWLRLRRLPAPSGPFTYTLEVPGVVEIREISRLFCVREERAGPWLYRFSRQRAGLALPLRAGAHVVVRNRLPGDRIQPLGCSYQRRVKDVMIDKKVPRQERDRLPLLCVADRIVWIPGVTIDHRFRVPSDGSRVWQAEIISHEAT